MSAGTKNTFLGPDIPHPSSSPVLHPNSLSPTPATDPPTPPSLLSVSWTLISMAATFLWMEESARGMGIEVPRRFLPWDEDSISFFFHQLVAFIYFPAQSQKPGLVWTGKLCRFLFANLLISMFFVSFVNSCSSSC